MENTIRISDIPQLVITPEMEEELERLSDRPIIFDEDCPEVTPEQAVQFRRVYPRSSAAD